MNARPEALVQAESILPRMSKLLGLKLDSECDLVRIVANGVSARTYKRIEGKLKFPAVLVASESTVRRRLASNSRFTAAESERIVRLTRVFAEAAQLFGKEDAALKWLNTPADYVPGQMPITPMALAASDCGARLIASHINRTAWGVY